MDSDVAAMLTDTAATPLGNEPLSGKASLAGVQDKVLLARQAQGWARCLTGYPSTHILKPTSRVHPDMIYNEEYCARIARGLGLVSFASAIESFDGIDAFVIERYDRSPDIPDGRIHQEDMNQALGASGNEKYQERGGKVSLGRIAHILSSTGDRIALEHLLRMNVLAVAAGNLDMHAKNISMLHLPDGSTRIAPAYGMVPMTHYAGVDGRIALAINGGYEHESVTAEGLAAEATSWGMPPCEAEQIVEETAASIRAILSREEPHPKAFDRLPDVIDGCAKRLLQR